MVIDKRKKSKTTNEVIEAKKSKTTNEIRLVENMNKYPKSFLKVSILQKPLPYQNCQAMYMSN